MSEENNPELVTETRLLIDVLDVCDLTVDIVEGYIQRRKKNKKSVSKDDINLIAEAMIVLQNQVLKSALAGAKDQPIQPTIR